MGKRPSFPFYPGDWTRDLDDQPLEVEGAWIRICCRLWWADEKGKATKSLSEWSRVLRTHPNKTGVILKTLLTKKIADGVYLDNQSITIISRRMVRDAEISLVRQEVGRMGGNPALKKPACDLDNQNDNQKRPLSFSSSNKPPISPKGEKYSDGFLSFWKAYPNRSGKDAAWRMWEKRKKKGTLPPIDDILKAIEDQKAWRDNAAPGDFRPEWKNPATWINQGCWADEVPKTKAPARTESKATAKAVRCPNCGITCLESDLIDGGCYYCKARG